MTDSKGQRPSTGARPIPLSRSFTEGPTEGTETVLPTAPQTAYQVDGQPVAVWRMVIVSTTRGGVIGDADYFAALEKAAPYRLDGRADAVLLRGLTAEELEGLMD